MKHLKSQSKNKNSKQKVTMLQAFKTIILPRINLVFIGLVLIVIKSLSGLVLPWQSKVLLDEVVPNKNYNQLYTLIVLVLSTLLIHSATSFLLTWTCNKKSDIFFKTYATFL
ncbi:MAG: hypothetical protein ACO3VF_10040, partial [Tamlana sp.]